MKVVPVPAVLLALEVEGQLLFLLPDEWLLVGVVDALEWHDEFSLNMCRLNAASRVGDAQGVLWSDRKLSLGRFKKLSAW